MNRRLAVGIAAVVAPALAAVGCAVSGKRLAAGPRSSAGSPERNRGALREGLRIGGMGPAPESRDELLLATGDAVWRGDLVMAHATLTRLADREHGLPDTALDFWSDLLALLRCEPLERAPRPARTDRPFGDPWDVLRRLVQVERVRLGRRGGASGAAKVLPESAPADSTPAGERRLDVSPDVSSDVYWPVEREHWSDELPMPAVVSRCAPRSSDGAETGSAGPPTAPEAAFVLQAAKTVPDGHPAKPLLLLQAAALAIAEGHPNGAASPLAKLETAPPATLSANERDQATLATALSAVADPGSTPEVVTARGRAAMALPLDPRVRRARALSVAARLVQLGRVEEATEALGPPPHGDDRVGRYIAFRQVQAHARAGRRAELLAEARELLHRQSRAEVDNDAALSAVMDLALRALLASPVSPETLETIESLGPPRERLARAEAFAQIALETGAHTSAMATFSWLYDNDTDSSRQLRHLARASVAAARASNRTEFARTFRLLAGQVDLGTPPASSGHKPGTVRAGSAAATGATASARSGALIASGEADQVREQRREARSANWQRALLLVARDALAALVEADDQANLATLVDTLKRHLGDGGRGPVDEELTTLYRAASAHLKSGARAYAETVGAPRRPILLGDVLVGREYEVFPPRVDLRAAVGEVGPLVFVPRRGNDPAVSPLERWPGRFGVAWAGSGS